MDLSHLNYDRYKFALFYVDTLGDYLSPILELGQGDLLCGFYRAKFTFPIVFQWEQDLIIIKGFLQQDPFQYAK